jgi:hypothetical protein
MAKTKTTKSKPKTRTSKNTKLQNTSKQKDLIVVMLLSLILGLGGGYLISTVATDSNSDSTQSSKMDASTSHMHTDLYEVPADQAPKVELVVVEDAKSGYNIKIITTNFKFTPENVNGENVIGEGHAHLYVDGEKIGRVYGEYYHYNGNFEGSKKFLVTLNANDHSDYAVNGDKIQSEVVVTHDASEESHNEMHSNDDMNKKDEM